jgi:hypothetical protein
MSYLEYLDRENLKYNLEGETVQVFELLGYDNNKIIDVFNNHAAKTNFYYIISKEEKNIKQTFNIIENAGFNQN